MRSTTATGDDALTAEGIEADVAAVEAAIPWGAVNATQAVKNAAIPALDRLAAAARRGVRIAAALQASAHKGVQAVIDAEGRATAAERRATELEAALREIAATCPTKHACAMDALEHVWRVAQRALGEEAGGR